MLKEIMDAIEKVDTKKHICNHALHELTLAVKEETGQEALWYGTSLIGFEGSPEYVPEGYELLCIGNAMDRKASQIHEWFAQLMEDAFFQAVSGVSKPENTMEEMRHIEILALQSYEKYCKEHGVDDFPLYARLVTDTWQEVNSFFFEGNVIGFSICTFYKPNIQTLYMFPTTAVSDAMKEKRAGSGLVNGSKGQKHV